MSVWSNVGCQMSHARSRPDWYAVSFIYGLAFAVSWQLVEDLYVGQWKVYAGIYYPWRQVTDWGITIYWIFFASEAVLLFLLLIRPWNTWFALAIGAILFLDNLGSFLNHRLLMSIEFCIIGLRPFPKTARANGFREKGVHWNLDVIRFQVSLVYLVTAVHKINAEFMSGETLRNLFWMIQHHGMKSYPLWLSELLLNPSVCLTLAWLTVGCELILSIGLNDRRLTCWLLPVAICMHLTMCILMPYIKIFTVQMLVTLIVFLPDRIQDGKYVLKSRSSSDGPTRLLSVLWPGYVVTSVDRSIPVRWHLELPNGELAKGYDAWVELLSLSPFTFLGAEIMRCAMLRRVGRFCLG